MARSAPLRLGLPALIKTANWMSHLAYDWKGPLWRHLARELSREFQRVSSSAENAVRLTEAAADVDVTDRLA